MYLATVNLPGCCKCTSLVQMYLAAVNLQSQDDGEKQDS